MEIDSIKIGEYLKTYSLAFSMALYYKESMYECFKHLVEKNKTTLSLDEFNKMLSIKNYYSASMILFYAKDIHQKGLNDIKFDSKEIFDGALSPINFSCFDNFTIRDIIVYTRNAIAHNKNNLASIFIDGSKLKICIKLKNTIASKGSNKGKNVPFEIELDGTVLLKLSLFCINFARTINITGVDFNQNVVKNSSSTNILQLLKEVVYTTYYTYTLFNTINDKDKRKLYDSHVLGNEKRDMNEFDLLKGKFVRKEEKVVLSDNQKKCIFYAMEDYIEKNLELQGYTPLTLSISKSKDRIKEILGDFMQQYYEYEALKFIPMGKEKHNNHIVSILLNCYYNHDESIDKTQLKLINDLRSKGVVYSLFEGYNRNDPEELTMFLNNICDSSYLEQEAASIYYNYVFETFIPEGEIITINGIKYKSDRIRNAFTHGRWYFDDETNSWHLFDNKDSLNKEDQYRYDWEVIIRDEDLHVFVDEKLDEAIAEKNKII